MFYLILPLIASSPIIQFKIRYHFCQNAAAVVTPSVSESAIDDTSRGVSPSSQTLAVSSVHVTVPSAQSHAADFKTANQSERTRQETSVSIDILQTNYVFIIT